MQQLLHRGDAVKQHRNEEILDASWDDLKSFLVCAKHKSFRNAAEMLGLTSTTLMRRIDRLEERIGCKLFLRDQSGLTLSEEGLAMIGDVTEMERHAFNIFRRMSRGWNPISPFSSNRRQIPTLSSRKSADFTSILSCPKDTGSSTVFLHRCPSSRTTELSSKTRRRWTIPHMLEFWD